MGFVKNPVVRGQAITLPSGGSGLRPAAPRFGSFRFNTDLGLLEFFNGSLFRQVAVDGDANLTVDSFTGDGSTLTFSLSVSATDEEQVIVFVGSIYQQPTDTYTITGGGDDITFTSAPPDGEPVNVIHGVSSTP